MQLNEAYKSLPKRRRSKKEEPTEAERKKERKKRGAKEKQEKMNTSQRLCPMVFIMVFILRFTYLKIGLTLVHPADGHIGTGQIAIGRESEADVAQGTCLYFKCYILINDLP